MSSPAQQAEYLINKFPKTALKKVEETIEAWKLKQRYPSLYRKKTCVQTINYWYKVKREIKKENEYLS